MHSRMAHEIRQLRQSSAATSAQLKLKFGLTYSRLYRFAYNRLPSQLSSCFALPVRRRLSSLGNGSPRSNGPFERPIKDPRELLGCVGKYIRLAYRTTPRCAG